MLREMASGVIYDTRIETTLARAKAARPYLERLITKAVQGVRAEQAAAAAGEAEKQALAMRAIHLRREVRRKLQQPALVKHLFDQVAVHFLNRPGGYTRIIKTGRRRGDGAEMAILEFVE